MATGGGKGGIKTISRQRVARAWLADVPPVPHAYPLVERSGCHPIRWLISPSKAAALARWATGNGVGAAAADLRSLLG